MSHTKKTMSKKEVLSAIVGLAFVNDAHLLNEDRVLAQMVDASEWQRVRDAALLVDALLSGFDYLASPEFEKKVNGKPPSVRAMMQRMASEPVRVRESRARLEKALTAILESDEAFQLIPESKHGDLARLLQLIKGMSVPG